MSKLINGGVAAAVMAGALTAVLNPAQAEARACFILTELDLVDGYVVGSRERYCNPPDVFNPLPTTIQRKSGTSWVDVSATGSGGAYYHCVGTSTRTYRLKETISKTITVACS
jgi:hypothetical protein